MGIHFGTMKRMQFFAFVSLFCMSCGSADADQRRRIYFLESLSPALPAAVRTIDAFKQRLSERTTESFEIFVDYMELVRAPTGPGLMLRAFVKAPGARATL